MWVGIVQPFEGLKRTKMWSWESAFCPQKGTQTPGSPGSQAFELRLNYTNVFCSPAC